MSLTIGLILGSIFCLIHLGIGLTLGWRFGRAAAPPMQFAVPAFPAANRSQVQHVLSMCHDLKRQLDEFSAASRESRQVKVAALSQRTLELEAMMNDLHQDLDRGLIGNEPIAANIRPACQASIREEGHPDQRAA
jgi:hypothetical protein